MFLGRKIFRATLHAAAVSAATKAIIFKNMTDRQLLKLTVCVALISILFEIAMQTINFTKWTKPRFNPRFEDGLEYYTSRKNAVEGFDEDPRFLRQNNVLYSGDIVFINSASNPTIATATTAATSGSTSTPTPTQGLVSSLQRAATTSEVVLAPAVNGVQSNLSKLRIELTDHDPQVLKPIHYGDTVYIKHNANVNNANTSLFIKISDELVSHQTGPLFNQFIISNAANAQDKGFVQPGASVAISNLASGGISSGFLNVDAKTNKITNSATAVGSATPFTIQLERVVENGDKHLCICVDDILYP